MSLQVVGRESAGDSQPAVTQACGVRGGDEGEWGPDLRDEDESAKPAALGRLAVGTLQPSSDDNTDNSQTTNLALCQTLF